MSDLIGRSLGHYLVVEKIGEGGMGEVYRAHDERLDREVAIKVLHRRVLGDRDRLDRFQREARAVARLSHPNVLAIFELGLHQEAPFIVTELLEGSTLGAVVKTGPVPPERATDIACQMADGLAAAHEQGIVHRDLKPDNVFLCSNGRVKILDFGLARLVRPTYQSQTSAPTESVGTTPGSILGTVGYMSPEQVRGEPADTRSDVFSFGCVLYELLAGQRAFRHETAAETMTAILREEPPAGSLSPPAIPVELGRVIRKCLEKDPQRRYPSGRELEDALRDLDLSAGHAQRPEDRPSVAVLPFANLSADQEQEYFCDGMAEEIINALAHVEGLRVVARTSSFAFKGQNRDVRAIGGDLGVTHVLEGSVRKSGDRLRITAQFVDVADGCHLWSDRFDRRLEDVFAIQDEISLAIVENLSVRLLGREHEAVVRRYTDNLEAYNAYLEGLFNWHKLTSESFARSIEYFRLAIARDPDFAPAYVGLGVWYLSQSFWAAIAPAEGISKALELSAKALALDDGFSVAHSLVGCAQAFFRRDKISAEKSLRRAVELGPSVAVCRSNLAVFLLVTGRLEEAAAEARMTVKLDPLSSNLCAWAGNWIALAGHHEEGEAEVRRMVQLHPDEWVPRHQLAEVLFERGEDLTGAVEESRRAVELSGRASVAMAQLATLLTLAGEQSEADGLHGELLARSTQSYVAPSFFAEIELARGDVDGALKRLEEAAEANDGWLFFVRFWVRAMPVRDDRIEELLNRLGV